MAIPGKYTRTQQLAAPVQRRTTAKTTADGSMFLQWRNFQLEDSIKKAAHDKVRYAGMGWVHFNHVRDHPPTNSHPFDMDGDDLARFQTETRRLGKLAKP
ncbi:MAG: hypothetical protein E6J91_12570 [Deltaproteobacteria bacterium]|nr:MAG: hypothetical protein E6J91_12570 [Deltaproteobacteria bacterium]